VHGIIGAFSKTSNNSPTTKIPTQTTQITTNKDHITINTNKPINNTLGEPSQTTMIQHRDLQIGVCVVV